MRFARVYSGIRKVKVILLGEEAEKAFRKLRDQYAYAKKAMKGTFKFRTSTKAISKAKEKLTRLQFLQWLDDYIRPRKSENNIESDNSDYEGETKRFGNNYAEEDDVFEEER